MRVSITTKDAMLLMKEGAIALAQAEQNGMNIDLEYCKKTSHKIGKRIERSYRDLGKTDFVKRWKKEFHGDFNPNSDPQLRRMVYDVYKNKVLFRTDAGMPSTSQEALSAIDMPEVDEILKIRKLDKIKGTYLDGFIREQVDGIVHPFFNLHLLLTYRSSSDSPNFQNLPSRDKEAMNLVRGAIIPPKGMLIGGIDYSGVEVRVGACLHQDPQMLTYIKDKRTDMHRDMAIQLYKLPAFDKTTGDNTLRKGTKNSFVFPEFYGSYWEQCAPNLLKWTKGVVLSNGVPIKKHLKSVGLGTPERFAKHVKEVEKDFWEKRFGIYTKWKERRLKEYQKNGYFDLVTGFRCSGVMRRNQVFNYPIQGPAFHCLLWVIPRINKILREEGYRSRIIGQIHDELVMVFDPTELTKVLNMVKHVMITELPRAWKWLIVPLDVEITVAPKDVSWNKKREVTYQDGKRCKKCNNSYLYWEFTPNGHPYKYECPVCRTVVETDIPF